MRGYKMEIRKIHNLFQINNNILEVDKWTKWISIYYIRNYCFLTTLFGNGKEVR